MSCPDKNKVRLLNNAAMCSKHLLKSLLPMFQIDVIPVLYIGIVVSMSCLIRLVNLFLLLLFPPPCLSYVVFECSMAVLDDSLMMA
ncbi:hypothetical protein COLO4_09022 [Corchorus olitorius]|uniref:Uncharacterized protein n=1 Tax=Corchorus olitorius TaxID=93759 RepID=A0A1R3KDI7_9ROSI|nr:hypothetical protein COLO4_09022 [Corchorus olitorius]